MKHFAIGLFLCVTLCSCAGPKPRAPSGAAISAPTQWRDHSPLLSEIDPKWWCSFKDPMLNALVEKALIRNDELAISASRLAEADADFRRARSALLPVLNATAIGARARDVSAFGKPELQTDGGSRLAFEYDTDLFGRLKMSSEAARALYLASAAAHASVKTAVIERVTEGYVGLRALDRIFEIALETLKVRRESLTLAQRRVATGYAPTLDLKQAEAEYEAALRLVPAARLAVRQQENALAVLVGEAPQAVQRGEALEALTAPPLVGFLPSALLNRRPDIIEAEQAVVSADRNLDAARAAFMPDLTLGVSAGSAFSTLLANPIAIWSVGGSILAPLFAGGRLHAQQDSAGARRDEAAFAYRKAVLGAFQQVEDALASVRDLHEQVTALELECEALEHAARIATNRYRAGYSPYLEQLDAQRSLLSTQVALVQMRSSYLNSFVALYRAMGGGWSRW